MSKNIATAQKHVLQYWFVDGLAEQAAGLVSLFLGVLFGIWQSVFTWRWGLFMVLGAGLVVSFALRLTIQRIKERSTYRRTGYAAPFSGLETRRSIFIAVAFTLILLVSNYYLSTKGPQGLLWSPALAGGVFAFIFAWTADSTKLMRFYVLALFSICAGVVIAFLRMDYFRGVGILAGVVGLVLLFQGYRVRKVYTQQNPPPGTKTLNE